MFRLKLQICVNMDKFGDLISTLVKFNSLVFDTKNFWYVIFYDNDNNSAELNIQYKSDNEKELLDLSDKFDREMIEIEVMK